MRSPRRTSSHAPVSGNVRSLFPPSPRTPSPSPRIASQQKWYRVSHVRLAILGALSLWSLVSQVVRPATLGHRALEDVDLGSLLDPSSTPVTSPTRSLSSLDRLLETAHGPWIDPNATCACSNVLPDYMYVNCAAASVHPASPRSLLQCHHHVQRTAALGDHIVTMIPRTDLFPLDAASSVGSNMPDNRTFALPAWEPLGTIHFHFSDPLPLPADQVQRMTEAKNRKFDVDVKQQDLEWFTTMALQPHRTIPYFAMLGRALSAAFGCTWVNASRATPASFQCPRLDPTQVASTMEHTWSVPHTVLEPLVYPTMYQLPATTPVAPIDPVTPSVGIYHYAFAETNTSRLLLHIPMNDSCCEASTPLLRHRQVLIQLNSCNVPERLVQEHDHDPFARNITTTTLPSEVHNVLHYESAILIGALWSWDFYHGSVEHVPRLLLLKDFMEQLDASIPILLVHSHKGCLLCDYARQWGLAHRVVRVKLNDVVYARTLYIPEPSSCLSLQPLMAQAQRFAIGQRLRHVRHGNDEITLPTVNPFYAPNHTTAIDVTNVTQDWIVVIQRRRKRFLRNHNDMMTALVSAYPDETFIVFDEQNLGQLSSGLPQWNIFARAKLVMAPHGAGLSNLLAVAPGTHVIEFLGKERDFELCFLHLALGLGLHYHPLSMGSRSKSVRESSYVANVPHVVQVVGTILDSIRATTVG